MAEESEHVSKGAIVCTLLGVLAFILVAGAWGIALFNKGVVVNEDIEERDFMVRSVIILNDRIRVLEAKAKITPPANQVIHITREK